MNTEKHQIKFDLPLENGNTVEAKATMTTKAYFDNECEDPGFYVDITLSYAGRVKEIKHAVSELSISAIEEIEKFLGTANFKIGE